MILTRKEYELLSLLVQNAGEIIPRDALLWRVWGYSHEIRTRTLDVHIRRLRKKLGSEVALMASIFNRQPAADESDAFLKSGDGLALMLASPAFQRC